MKKVPLFALVLLSLSLYGDIGSSIKVPVSQHSKYTFGHPRNQAVFQMEKRQYYKSIAPMKVEDIRNHLTTQGYEVRGIELRDIVSELVYQVYVTDATGIKKKLYVDPANGSVLKSEPIQ